MLVTTLPSIPPTFAKLMNDYSGIPPDKQHDHILQLRDRAYKHYPYPCLGRWRFLDLDLSVHPLYQRVLDILTSDLKTPNIPQTTFLDLGCCLGQDIRKLISDLLETTSNIQLPHPPRIEIAKRLYGADLRPEFIQLGYELFNDEESTLPRNHFTAPADVFETSPTAPLAALDGKVSVLNCTAVFHLFSWDEQKKLAARCLKLLNRSGIASKDGSSKKALLLGAQTANVTADEYARRSGGTRFRHNDRSWSTLWDDVTKESEWKDVVKGVEVGSELQERSVESKGRDMFGERQVDTGKQDGSGSVLAVGSFDEDHKPKMIGKLEEGFRWQVWWVWVEFY